MTEPYDVILALRTLHFDSPDAVAAWLSAPNPDLGGSSVALAVQRGRYDAAIRAIALERERRDKEGAGHTSQ